MLCLVNIGVVMTPLPGRHTASHHSGLRGIAEAWRVIEPNVLPEAGREMEAVT